MGKRLIELGEAVRMTKNSREDCPETSIKGRAIWVMAHNCALSCLVSCPTVDAVEVVRCKNCKNCELCYPEKQLDKEATPAWLCKRYKMWRDPDFFCAAGERRIL